MKNIVSHVWKSPLLKVIYTNGECELYDLPPIRYKQFLETKNQTEFALTILKQYELHRTALNEKFFLEMQMPKK